MSTSSCQTLYRPVLVGVVLGASEKLLLQPPCKMWSCEYCARMSQLLWREKIRQGIDFYIREGLDLWSFVTITMSAKIRGFRYSISKWPKCWARLSSRIRRAWPGIRYVLLPEQHEDGTLHTHAIMGAAIGNTWISKSAHKCGLGYMSQSKPLRSSSLAAFYVSKYVGKSLTVEDWPKGFRRIRTSQKWPALANQEDYEALDAEWSFLKVYNSNFLHILAEGLTDQTGIVHRVLSSVIDLRLTKKLTAVNIRVATSRHSVLYHSQEG